MPKSGDEDVDADGDMDSDADSDVDTDADADTTIDGRGTHIRVFDSDLAISKVANLLTTLGALAFSVQILADFSAYTDIARGSARLLGFELMDNFNHPYPATGPAEFWRRSERTARTAREDCAKPRGCRHSMSDRRCPEA